MEAKAAEKAEAFGSFKTLFVNAQIQERGGRLNEALSSYYQAACTVTEQQPLMQPSPTVYVGHPDGCDSIHPVQDHQPRLWVC